MFNFDHRLTITPDIKLVCFFLELLSADENFEKFPRLLILVEMHLKLPGIPSEKQIIQWLHKSQAQINARRAD